MHKHHVTNSVPDATKTEAARVVCPLTPDNMEALRRDWLLRHHPEHLTPQADLALAFQRAAAKIWEQKVGTEVAHLQLVLSPDAPPYLQEVDFVPPYRVV